MVIQSNFKDYYDSLLSNGHDESLYYRRITETFDLSEKGGDEEKIKLAKAALSNLEAVKDKYQLWERVVVGFCGKLYVALRYKEVIPHTYPLKFSAIKYYYDKASLMKAFPGRDDHNEGYTSYWEKAYKPYPQLGLYDSGRDDLFVELGVPIFLIDSVAGIGKDKWGRDIPTPALVTNPSLKSLEFYKVMSDYEVFQELEMYLGNILVGEKKAEPVLSDKLKIASKGFDPKYGFRTRKKE